MDSQRRTTKCSTRLSNELGYSLVELITAIGVAVVVGLGIYAVFNYTQKSALSQKIYNDMQTSCGFAMSQIKSELTLAGYRAVDLPSTPAVNESRLAVLTAGGTTVTFHYYDDNARNEAPYAVGYDSNTRVTYRLQAGDLIRQMTRHIPGGEYDAVNVTNQTLASNIGSLTFTYLAGDNAAWTSGNLADIRSIRSTLTCNASRPDPNTERTPQITLTSEVRARNAGVASVATDTTPPGKPEGLVSVDPGVCGSLQLRWDANTEPDLEGYTIFYGLESGIYSERMVIARPPKTTGQNEYLTVTALDSSVTGITPPPKYYFAISAYDKSGNVSLSLSTEATGDTIINPQAPAPPGSFTATPGTNAITLTWTKSPAAGLLGYRLYRGSSAGFTPTDANRIAGEGTLKADFVSYTDSSLVGCTDFYYKIATITCDYNQPMATMQFDEKTARPTDTTPPPTPTLTARPGFRRIILYDDNTLRATTPDYAFTKIWFKENTVFPVLNPDGITSDGTPIPDYGGVITVDGLVAINFDSMTVANPPMPSLNRDATYSFLAVSYDLCGNHSDVTSQAQALGNQCGDGPLGPPAAVTGISAAGCFDPVTVTWNPVDPITHPDFTGYHVFRCNMSTDTCGYPCVSPSTSLPYPGWVEQTDAYTWQTSWVDTQSKGLVAGAKFAYCVQSTDCYYEENRWTWPQPGDDATNDPKDNFTESIISTPVAVGKVEFASGVTPVVTGYLQPTLGLNRTLSSSAVLGFSPPTFWHDTVSFWARNSSADNLTLTSFSASWENKQDYLQLLAFGDGETTPVKVAWKAAGLPLTNGYTGSTVTLAAGSTLLKNDDNIPVTLRLRESDGSPTIASDARQQIVDFTLTYRNESTATDGCSVTGSLDVPLGPYVYSTTQDRPSAGTPAWPVPGPQGSNTMNVVTVPGGQPVNVFSNVYYPSTVSLVTDRLSAAVDATITVIPLYLTLSFTTPGRFEIEGESVWCTGRNTGTLTGCTRGYDGTTAAAHSGETPVTQANQDPTVKLYYYVDSARTLTAAPPVSATAVFPDLTPYTGVDLVRVAGNLFRTSVSPVDNRIPVNDGSNIWYFIVAVGADGNFDREPEIGAGAFQYYQQPANVCAIGPNPPTLAGSLAGLAVRLDWTPPATNVGGGSAYTDGKGYRVYRAKDAAGFGQVAEITNTATLTWSDAPGDLAAAAYRYYVTAFDLCTPTPNESAPSTIYSEALESDCGNTPSPPTQISGTASSGPDQVTLTWQKPTTNAPPSIAPLTDLGGYEVYRQVSTGAFTYLATVSAAATSYQDLTATDIKNVRYSYYLKSYDTCTSPRHYSDPSDTYTDPVVNNPCDETPGKPGLTGSNTTTSVSLTWSPPAQNTNGELFQDAGGYKVFRSVDGGPYLNIGEYGSSTFSLPAPDTPPDMGIHVYRYQVTVFDICTVLPGPYESVPSVYFEENHTYIDPCSTIPTAIPSLSATGSGSGVQLSWSAPSPNPGDLDGYLIQRKADSGSYADLAGSPFHPWATTYNDTTVTDAGTKAYSYQVKALDSCNNPSPTWTAASETYDVCTPAPAAPGQPVFTYTPAPSCASPAPSVKMVWTAVTGTVTEYQVYRQFCGKNDSASSTGTCWPFTNGTKIGTVAAATLTYTDTPGVVLKVGTGSPGRKTFYGIRAVNGTCSTNVKVTDSAATAPCN